MLLFHIAENIYRKKKERNIMPMGGETITIANGRNEQKIADYMGRLLRSPRLSKVIQIIIDGIFSASASCIWAYCSCSRICSCCPKQVIFFFHGVQRLCIFSCGVLNEIIEIFLSGGGIGSGSSEKS